jgi:hypothetical protein
MTAGSLLIGAFFIGGFLPRPESLGRPDGSCARMEKTIVRITNGRASDFAIILLYRITVTPGRHIIPHNQNTTNISISKGF